MRTLRGESRISRKKGCWEFSSLSYRLTIYVADASHHVLRSGQVIFRSGVLIVLVDLSIGEVINYHWQICT